jgi:hypothetical protein
MTKSNCKKCGSIFDQKVFRGKTTKYCSHACYWGSMKGVPHGHKTVNGYEAWNKGLKFPEQTGEAHFAWKGEYVSYRNLHHWVERLIGKPNKCAQCGKVGYGRQIHWANKSRTYKRELSDWIRLCAKCHKAYDRKPVVLQ